MKRTLKRLSYGSAIFLGEMFYLMTISVHILILAKVIPLEWISGGRVSSFEQQLQISIINLFIAVAGMLFISWANHSRESNSVRLVAMILTIVWGGSLFAQLIGTPFEQFVMSWVVLTGFISHLRLSIKN